jgi:hypothetical protein
VNLTLAPGKIYAGFSRPWYASQSAVKNKLKSDYGIVDVVFHKRGEAIPVDPFDDSTYNKDRDEWDEWISARYAGPGHTVDVKKVWAWLLNVPDAVAEKPVRVPSGSKTPEFDPDADLHSLPPAEADHEAPYNGGVEKSAYSTKNVPGALGFLAMGALALYLLTRKGKK